MEWRTALVKMRQSREKKTNWGEGNIKVPRNPNRRLINGGREGKGFSWKNVENEKGVRKGKKLHKKGGEKK